MDSTATADREKSRSLTAVSDFGKLYCILTKSHKTTLRKIHTSIYSSMSSKVLGKDILEFGFVIDLLVGNNVVEQLRQYIGISEVLDQLGIVCLAFLKQVILAEYFLKRDVGFIKQCVYSGTRMETKPPKHCLYLLADNRKSRCSGVDKC